MKTGRGWALGWSLLWGALAAPLVAGAQQWEVVSRGPILVQARPAGGGGAREVWAEGELDAEVQDLQSAILDTDAYPRFMPYVKEARTLGATPEGDSLVYTRLEPPLIGSHDYVVRVRVRKQVGPDGRGEFSNAWHAVPDHLPRRSSVVRLRVCEGSWTIAHAPSGRARVVYRTRVDGGSWIPGFLSNLASSAGTLDTLRAMEREARRRGDARRARAASGTGGANGASGTSETAGKAPGARDGQGRPGER